MDIDIVLSAEEIIALLREATPVRIHLTDKDEDTRWVELEVPTEVTLVPDVGIRIVSSGRIRYELAGIQLPFSIRRVQLLFLPQVVSVAGEPERLDFKLSLEAADLENIPGVAERMLMTAVNELLAPERLGTVWNFGRMLDRSFVMPERYEPLNQLMLRAPLGRVTITAEELRVRLQIGLGFSRNAPRPSDG
jgi:hypothetical protein